MVNHVYHQHIRRLTPDIVASSITFQGKNYDILAIEGFYVEDYGTSVNTCATYKLPWLVWGQ